jgi:hypothetical protein
MSISGYGASVQSVGIDNGAGLNSNIIARLQKWLPTGWFPNKIGTRIFATLAGFSAALSTVLAQINYVKLQTRIKTATDGFLDLISWDYFGPSLPRLTNEQDKAFRVRILANLLRPRATRAGMIAAITSLTGNAPIVVEPKRPLDTGGYGAPCGGYNKAGAYSNPSVWQYQCFITVFLGNNVTFAQVCAVIEATKPVATQIWVAVGAGLLTDQFGNPLTDQNGNQLYAQ